MRRTLLAALLVAVSAFTPAHQAVAVTTVTPVEVEGGLAFPSAMTVAPDGRIYYGERFTGEIRWVNPFTGVDTHVFTLPNIATDGEQGLLGIALPPGFPDPAYVFAYVTRLIQGTAQNQVVRINIANGVGTGFKVLVRISAGIIHNGGAMVFGPSGKLHVVVGENGDPSNSQNTTKLTGKVLRITQAGKGASGNAFGNKVFSYGHRNMFGIAIDPQNGRLWVTENGPECNDEINLLASGGNFAWGPNESCTGIAPQDTNADGPSPRLLPKFFYSPTIAPTGAVFCNGCGLGSDTEGTLLFGAWNDGAIRRLTLTADRLGIASSSVLVNNGAGILAMARAPNGTIYYSDPDQILVLTA